MSSTSHKPIGKKNRVTSDASISRLAVIFGDQLDHGAPLLAGLDKSTDAVLMMEVAEESKHVPSHVQRTVLFLSAMRHFAQELTERGFRVCYVRLEDPDNTHSFASEIERAVRSLQPAEIRCTSPGEWRVQNAVQEWSKRFGIPVTVLPDSHFITSVEEFAAWANDRRGLTMEYFYREQRRKTGYLMTGNPSGPVGGEWNFDKDNRTSFGASGPRPPPKQPIRFAPDALTRDVINAVREHLPGLPGRLDESEKFGWPVSRAEALACLKDFVAHRLSNFGPFEDAMWTNTPYVYHSALSPALNLKLLNPRECCEAALAAYRANQAPLQSVEAFIRQIIGWREFIRGVYWLEGPDYALRNGLDQHGKLPEMYWTGDTDMACMRSCLSQVLDHSYGHHIQRLMVTGNFALMSGVHPRAISDWYLGMYADGIDWVTLPNTLGMVMHADQRPNSPPSITGLVGTKPYCASGKYIQRMSNYCKGCRYDPALREGPTACPFTVFYWDFLIRNRDRLRGNNRMAMMLKNVDRLSAQTLQQVTIDAAALRTRFKIERH